MSKLSCGCVPDASVHDYEYRCSDCTQQRRTKIWEEMSDKDKNYDRYVASRQSTALDFAAEDEDNQERYEQ